MIADCELRISDCGLRIADFLLLRILKSSEPQNRTNQWEVQEFFSIAHCKFFSFEML